MTAIDTTAMKTTAAVLGIANVLLVAILGHQLRVAPADVRQEVISQSQAIQAETQRLSVEVQKNREELSSRLPRIEALEQWVETARALNPDIEFPDIQQGSK